MGSPNIAPEKITHPFQLMAAWFVMLILLSSVLLTAAVKIEKPDWAAGFLVVSAVVLAFSVIVFVLLMLTRFRPHLQDGKDYSTWLRDERRYSNAKMEVYSGKRKPRAIMTEAVEKPESNDERLERLELFADAAKVNIEVANCADADEVVASLKVLGFQAQIYEQPFDNIAEEDTHESSHAIWLGANISTRVAMLAIAAAIEKWPFLCYVHLSTDSSGPDYTDNEIFIGGSTKTAIGYGLRKWSRTEFESIPRDTPLEKFHAIIRSKYS